MKAMQLVATCDMSRYVDGTTAEASETLFVALGSDPDNLRLVELDLTPAWAQKLRGEVGAYLAAGHAVGEVRMPGDGSASPGRGRSDEGTRAWNRALRKWAGEHGYRLTKLAKGGYYYPEKTKLAYRAVLEGRDAAWLAAHGLRPDYDELGNSV